MSFVKNVLVLLTVSFSAQMALGSDETVYELRTYTTVDGRLPALEKRFRDHTMRFFEKHGMQNVGYWIPIQQPNTLIYILAHDDMESAKLSWKSFSSDAGWGRVAKESQKDGRILIKGGVKSVFMKAADYSPLTRFQQ